MRKILKQIKMKNLKKISILVITLISLTLFTNCETENSEMTDSKLAMIDNIGLEHNKAMDKILLSIKKTKSSKKSLKRSEINSLIEKGINDFYEESSFLNKAPMSEIAISYYNENVNYKYLKSSNGDNLFSGELSLELDKLDELSNEYLNEESNRGIELYNLSQELKNNIPENLKDEESKIAWLGAVDVMGHSAKYWSENYINWYDAINGQDTSNKTNILSKKGWWKRFWKSVKKVVVADAKGAASGIVVHAITGGGSALAGGLGASAGAAVGEILK